MIKETKQKEKKRKIEKKVTCISYSDEKRFCLIELIK